MQLYFEIPNSIFYFKCFLLSQLKSQSLFFVIELDRFKPKRSFVSLLLKLTSLPLMVTSLVCLLPKGYSQPFVIFSAFDEHVLS